MKFKKLYKNIFLYSSLQFMGNVEEYFADRTEKLVVFIVMPRIQSKSSLLRLYKNGEKIEERKIPLFSNIFLYYFSWYINYVLLVLKYFKKNEKFYMISFHPLPLFFMTFQKMFREIEFVYWIGDYFPPINNMYNLFEKLKKFYNSRATYSLYLSDSINEIMNGRVLNTFNRKTVMWGVKPKNIKRKFSDKFNILFVGLIKESQGLEFLFEFLRSNQNYQLKIIGVCEKELCSKYQKLISKQRISNQVYFPNRFFSDNELNEISKECQIGIALYDINEGNATYYTDPGKIKAYAELGLPIIMSDISSIVPFIKKFKAGEIVDRNFESIKLAIKKIEDNYVEYLQGINKFNNYFYFEDYYEGKFKFLEN